MEKQSLTKRRFGDAQTITGYDSGVRGTVLSCNKMRG